mgnify:CR=1 FL=1|tara:strand:- start:3304 stop:4338 length:1035 start_codon:yes stop_codon:yes gene_type:complete
MKQQNTYIKTGLLKKIFIKICRILGYEIIDQTNFYIPTQGKNLSDNLSIPGKKSITVPLGETKITRKVNSLTVIFRSCTNINMLTQNKKRLFDKKKSEYTFRSLNSILTSLSYANNIFKDINFDVVIIDYNSQQSDIEQMKTLLNKFKFKHSLINLDINEFKKDIKEINEEEKKVTNNQISNMSNIHKSLLIAKNKCKDLVYFVEDDYLHHKEAFKEMIFAYERISSQLNNELFLCPADYPYLYNKIESTNIFLGSSKHWRTIGETLCTFLTSTKLVNKYWDKLVSMCQYEHYPFEKPLHDIYKNETCLSPMPSLAIHCTNINSVYGLSPTVDWNQIWQENQNY